jgi:hypothetical protein
VFNQEASYEQYLEMYKCGNHKSVEQNLEKVMLTMNKEDCKDHVLTFQAFLAEFIQDLMLTTQGFVMLPGKNDHPLRRVGTEGRFHSSSNRWFGR